MIEKINLSDLNDIRSQLNSSRETMQKSVNDSKKHQEVISTEYEIKVEDEARIIELLEQIKDSCFDLVHINELLPSTYIRVSAAIDCLIYQILEHRNDDLIEGNFYISLGVVNDIKQMSKSIDMDKNDIKVKDLIKIEISLLKKFIGTIMVKDNKEIEDGEIDKLLVWLKNADKTIDNKQN